MAQSFSANQYADAFYSKKLQNWEKPMVHRERPRAMDGFTQIISNDRGHLMEGIPRSQKNPWGDFVGTWDLPKHIPGNTAKVPTARTSHAQGKLVLETEKSNKVLSGKLKNETRSSLKLGAVGQPKQVTLEPGPSTLRRSGADNPSPKEYAKSPYPASPTAQPIGAPVPGTPPPPPRIITPVKNRSPSPPQKSPQPAKAEEGEGC